VKSISNSSSDPGSLIVPVQWPPKGDSSEAARFEGINRNEIIIIKTKALICKLN